MGNRKTVFKSIMSNIFNQIIPIMIGVYLGFAMNNYGESVKIRKDKAIFSQMLLNELSKNFYTIDRAEKYHMDLKLELDQLLESEDVVKSFKDYTFRGIRTPRLNSGSYQTGIQTGILKEFDLEYVQLVNQLYTNQAYVLKLNENILASLVAKEMPTDEGEIVLSLQNLQVNLNDMLGGEMDLKKYLCEFIRAYYASEKAILEICEVSKDY